MTYELEACRTLAWAVRDIQRGTRYEQEAALRFVQSDSVELWCEGLDLQPQLVREALCVKVSPLSPRGDIPQ